MIVTIAIPTPLRPYTKNQKKIEVVGNTVNIALQDLINKYPKLKSHLFEDGDLRNFVNIYLNNQDVRYLENKYDSSLTEGDNLSIIPSMAGGNL